MVPLVEIVVGVEVFILQVVVQAAMELVRAALGDDVHRRGTAAVLRIICIGLELHLLHRVLVGDEGSPSGYVDRKGLRAVHYHVFGKCSSPIDAEAQWGVVIELLSRHTDARRK